MRISVVKKIHCKQPKRLKHCTRYEAFPASPATAQAASFRRSGPPGRRAERRASAAATAAPGAAPAGPAATARRPLPPAAGAARGRRWSPDRQAARSRHPGAPQRRPPRRPGPAPPTSSPNPEGGKGPGRRGREVPGLTVICREPAPQGPSFLSGPGRRPRRGRAGAQQPCGGRSRQPPLSPGPPARRPPTFPPEEGHGAGEGARRPLGRGGRRGGRGRGQRPGLPMNETPSSARRRLSLRLFLPRRRQRPPCCQQPPRSLFRAAGGPPSMTGCGRGPRLTQHGRPGVGQASQSASRGGHVG